MCVSVFSHRLGTNAFANVPAGLSTVLAQSANSAVVVALMASGWLTSDTPS